MFSENDDMQTSGDAEGDSHAQRLDRMKSEFVVAQQRRRARAPQAECRPDDTGPVLAGPDAGSVTSIAAVRP